MLPFLQHYELNVPSQPVFCARFPCPCLLLHAVPTLQKIDLTQLAGTTLLIPKNSALTTFPASSLTDVNKIKAIAGFHVLKGKYTLDQILSASFSTIKSPNLLGPQTIYVTRATIPKKLFRPASTVVQFGGSLAVSSNSNKAAVGQTTFFTGTYFNAVGVDKIVTQ